jgi:threonine/homoserine/homoserine lactone efflux protein
MDSVNYSLILLAALMVMASPGPATLAIAGASMASGRRQGLATALGVTTGSVMWSVLAAYGLGAVMVSNAWVFGILKYLGAAYLLFLAFKSAVSATRPHKAEIVGVEQASFGTAYAKGLALHLTNPKAILFFGPLYSIGIPVGTPFQSLFTIIALLGIMAACIFLCYGIVFSSPAIVRGYTRLRRWFDGVFAVFFGAAALKILATPVK